MSGPKAVQLSWQARVRQREANVARCRASEAEYRRLEQELRQLVLRLADLGVHDDFNTKPHAEIERRSDELISSRREAEAAEFVTASVDKLRATMEKARSKLETQIAEL